MMVVGFALVVIRPEILACTVVVRERALAAEVDCNAPQRVRWQFDAPVDYLAANFHLVVAKIE